MDEVLQCERMPNASQLLFTAFFSIHRALKARNNELRSDNKALLLAFRALSDRLGFAAVEKILKHVPQKVTYTRTQGPTRESECRSSTGTDLRFVQS